MYGYNCFLIQWYFETFSFYPSTSHPLFIKYVQLQYINVEILFKQLFK